MVMNGPMVLSLGGSILAPDTFDPEFLDGLRELVLDISSRRPLLIVTGGGRTARKYIDVLRPRDITERDLDLVGIAATRLNGLLLAKLIGHDACPTIPETVDEAAELAMTFPIMIMGGTEPGHTTDAVSAYLAEKVGATSWINATAVDGIYTADPRKDPDATRFDIIGTRELYGIVKSYTAAGSNVVVDPVAVTVLARSNISGLVIDGRDLDILGKAMREEDCPGTRIVPDGIDL